jgi:hypothetical protein
LGKSLIRVTVILAENVFRYEARATFPVDFLLSQLEGTITLGKLLGSALPQKLRAC